MSPAPIAWPACDVPPPRIVSGHRRRAQMRTMRNQVLARPRHDDAERLDLVDAGVGGVERARDRSNRTSPWSRARGGSQRGESTQPASASAAAAARRWTRFTGRSGRCAAVRGPARGSRRRWRTRRAACLRRPRRTPRRGRPPRRARRAAGGGPRPRAARSSRTSTITNNPPSGAARARGGCRPAPPRTRRAGPRIPRASRPRTPGARQRHRGGVLDERGRAAARLLQHQEHRLDDVRRSGAVADAPAGHRVGLRQAVDQHRPARMLGRERGRRDVPVPS